VVVNHWFDEFLPKVEGVEPEERKPFPGRQPARRAVRSRRWMEEDALLRAAVIEFEGWVTPWSHIADAVAGRPARDCELLLGKLSADGA
jgi:hypothetical protein